MFTKYNLNCPLPYYNRFGEVIPCRGIKVILENVVENVDNIIGHFHNTQTSTTCRCLERIVREGQHLRDHGIVNYKDGDHCRCLKNFTLEDSFHIGDDGQLKRPIITHLRSCHFTNSNKPERLFSIISMGFNYYNQLFVRELDTEIFAELFLEKIRSYYGEVVAAGVETVFNSEDYMDAVYSFNQNAGHIMSNTSDAHYNTQTIITRIIENYWE